MENEEKTRQNSQTKAGLCGGSCGTMQRLSLQSLL